jgi:hypothetical protein
MQATKWATELKKRVQFAFCIPSRGTVSLAFAKSFRSIVLPMNTSAIMVSAVDTAGGEIAEARNQCVMEALQRGCTHLFWLDDDVCAEERCLIALHRHDREIASGVYFTKHELSEPLIFPASGGGTDPFLAEGTSEAWATGMGLCLIKAEVYRRMMREMPLGKDKYGRVEFYRTVSPEEGTVNEKDHCINFGSTEDFFFFRKCGELGISILVDHSPWAFGWHVDPKTLIGYPRAQYEQMGEGKPIAWKTPDGEMIWNPQ